VRFLFQRFYMFLCDLSFFFFSSRRRHTRSKRDWSSDVCSSDLLFKQNDKVIRQHRNGWWDSLWQDYFKPLVFRGKIECNGCFPRSEERRVGKECSARWGA